MAVTSQRKMTFTEQRQFGNHSTTLPLPDLTLLQTRSYERFLQADVEPEERENYGLEAVLRETFPIEDYEKNSRLDYVSYRLDKPRYTPDECRRLRLTYGRPFCVRLRLTKLNPETGETKIVEEDVYFGEVPVMLGGGEFIINGAERVVVSQIHRSPGVDFLAEFDKERKKSFTCRIIPERGSWIELSITRKETIILRMEKSSKLPVMQLIRAFDPKYSTNADLIRAFFRTSVVKIKGAESVEAIEGKISVNTVDFPKGSPHEGEHIVESCQEITKSSADELCASGVKSIEIIEKPANRLLLNSIEEDKTQSHEEALLAIFRKLRPGNPPQLDRARTLVQEKFFDVARYRLGRVGRFRINRKLGANIDPNQQALCPEDVINAVQYLFKLWSGAEGVQPDDIDHLGNRRIRTIDELAADEIRSKGALKLQRAARERIREETRPRNAVNQKNITQAIENFFGRNELSQVVDQTNPLSMLTHERRLSALGPGGLNRKRAGYEVRDVHSSHYGRICPIETPEGQNIGLISHLSLYAVVDELGFIVAPYRKVVDGVLTDQVDWLRADEEHFKYLAPADAKRSAPTKDCPYGKLEPDPVTQTVLARHAGEYEQIKVKKIEYIDVSPNQMIGVAAGLIPFLEHDDVTRALMGSNMQRQAVPLLVSEAPVVGTGLEREAALNSSLIVRSKFAGVVKYVDALRIEVVDNLENPTKHEVYHLRKFAVLNGSSCENQHPIVSIGQVVEEGEVLADGACTDHGVLALGRNVLVAFMVWDGYNYEDAIILSEELVQNDSYTSIHIEEYSVDVRQIKTGTEYFTRDIPNVGEKALRNLDENGIVRVGVYVSSGDILVGKVSPKSKVELSPEEKLLHAIFGRAGDEVKNDSLEVPTGVEGVVIGSYYFRTRSSLSEEERRVYDGEILKIKEDGDRNISNVFVRIIGEIQEIIGNVVVDSNGVELIEDRSPEEIAEAAKVFSFRRMCERNGIEVSEDEDSDYQRCRKVYLAHAQELEDAIDTRDREYNTKTCGEQLKRGVLQTVKVYIATKRAISVGDKMAGRHGNKGIISRILPREDMPFLADGTPIQIMLNPLGVPSRMNVGQILETHLGWAAVTQGYRAITPVFDGATEEVVNNELEKAGLPRNGKVQLYDGRTGEPFAQETTVGYMYMLKLHHLVDDKVHARSTGPYSLVTQQPLGGKARAGGQRFGEMEVWALEAYGAAYTLQEIMTVKSDDVDGRTKIYESVVNGKNTLQAGLPAAFEVLANEIKGLALNIELEPSSGRLPLRDRSHDDFGSESYGRGRGLGGSFRHGRDDMGIGSHGFDSFESAPEYNERGFNPLVQMNRGSDSLDDAISDTGVYRDEALSGIDSASDYNPSGNEDDE
ncbi:MAG: DNA-directed RNA polymerase subunit beta [Planctomycetia bacterium]|nr:DNA-directed RNA polymerase subunit beta [Planctomycetia bacterium]